MKMKTILSCTKVVTQEMQMYAMACYQKLGKGKEHINKSQSLCKTTATLTWTYVALKPTKLMGGKQRVGWVNIYMLSFKKELL